jgi:hypothetical protein
MSASISGITTYGLYKEPNLAAVSGVTAYATYPEPNILTLRNVQGYALVSDIALPKGVNGITALANLVLAQSKSIRPASQFTFGAPESYAGSETILHNSRVNVTAGATSALSGSMYFYYSRVSLARIPANLTAIVIGSATSTQGLIAAINTASGMVLTTDDIVDVPIAAGSVEVTITAASTSRFFIPGDTTQVGFTPTLASAFKSDTILWT